MHLRNVAYAVLNDRRELVEVFEDFESAMEAARDMKGAAYVRPAEARLRDRDDHLVRLGEAFYTDPPEYCEGPDDLFIRVDFGNSHVFARR